MTLRKKFFLLTTTSFLLSLAVSTAHQLWLYSRMVKEEERDLCENNFKEFRELVSFHKSIANAISSYVAKDRKVISAIKKDDRRSLYLRLRPLYEEVSRDGLIREMVIFKLPAFTYLNVRRPEAPRRDVSKIRGDVVRTGKTCVSTSTILVCINYVGIRVTSPVTEDGRKVLAVVSGGIFLSSKEEERYEVQTRNSGGLPPM